MFYDFHIFLSAEIYDILGSMMMTVNKCLPSVVKTENVEVDKKKMRI